MANVWLHYVGKNLYSKKSFIKEAKEFGVNRAVPKWMVGKHIKLGDKIYLAFHKKDKRSLKEKAIIFGFFIVEGFSFDVETAKELEKEGVGKTILHDDGPIDVKRGCGSYSIVGTFEVKDEEKFLEVLREKGNKIFVRGRFFELEEEEVIENVSFSRGYIRIEDEVEKPLRYHYDLSNEVIDNYNRVVYKKKRGKK